MTRRLAAAAAALGLLAVAACGSDGGDEGGSGSTGGSGGTQGAGELTAITVATVPIVEAAAVYVAKSEGFFEEVGLDVTIESVRTSSVVIPGLVSGQYDVGFTNMVTFLQANQQGIDLTAVTAASAPAKGDADIAALVAVDPAIKDAGDLAGKKIGLNAVNNIAAIGAWESIKAEGGDPKSAQFVELGFAEQLAAMQRGEIDGGFLVDPYLTLALQGGGHVVAYPYFDIDPELTISSWVSSAATLNDNPELVDKFIEAVHRAAKLLTDDSQVLFDSLADFSSIEPALYPELALCTFPTEINRESVQNWIDLMDEYGLLTGELDVDELIYQP